MQRLLIIRGGAIGDFILTLPAIGALRYAFPRATLEVLGQASRAILARHPAYADRITDFETVEWHRLFSPQAGVPDKLSRYLGAFDALFAYLPASADVLAARLRQYGPRYTVTWPVTPPGGRHMTDHLLQPVIDLRPLAYEATPRVYPTADALDAAERFWRASHLPDQGVLALHPGSGGAHKNWPLSGWHRVMRWAAQHEIPCVILCGPADQERVAWLQRHSALPSWPCVRLGSLLPIAAIMARCQVVVGHDSGMMHLAAASGSTTLALFGPTDPDTWAPRSAQAWVLQSRQAGPLTLESLAPEVVMQTLEALLNGTVPVVPGHTGCTLRQVLG